MTETLVGIAEARRRVLAAVRPLPAERVEVRAALGRRLAEPIRATGDVPPFPSSAMDGYALSSTAAARKLPVVGESRAGQPASRGLGVGEAIRISTGAALPEGADAVIRQEDTAVRDGVVELLADVRKGQNVRWPGEDMVAGAVVLDSGTRLGAPHLAAAVAAGHGTLSCAGAPTVALFSTGDELREPGEPLGPGEIHNSNAPMLHALVTAAGGEPRAPRCLADDRACTEEELGRALAASDVLVITGGVSVGPHDHVKPALAALGVEERFWRVALQPGKPTWFGTREGRLVFGLPGNPVSAYVTFILFVVPALIALQGGPSGRPRRRARLGVAVRRNPQREQAIRVVYEEAADTPTVVPHGGQGSHLLSSLIGADALAFIPAGDGELPAGHEVELEPLPS